MTAPAHACTPPPTFREVYEEHLDFVWRILRRLGIPESALEDVAQDVFVVVARKLETFEHRSSMRTWLFAIATKVALDSKRKHSRHTRKLVAFRWLRSQDRHDPTSRRDDFQLLAQLLATLSPEKRLVYILHELAGLTVVEIAAETGVNINTLHTRLNSARSHLEVAAADFLNQEGAA
ncbi:MAG: RNA polymerase sigma factor [Myxococcota bacterium]